MGLVRTQAFEVGGDLNKESTPAYFCITLSVLFYDKPENIGKPEHVVETALAHFMPRSRLKDFLEGIGHEFFMAMRDLIQSYDGSLGPDYAAVYIAGACTSHIAHPLPPAETPIPTDTSGMLNACKTLCKDFGFRVHGEHIGGPYGPKNVRIEEGQVICEQGIQGIEEQKTFVLSSVEGAPITPITNGWKAITMSSALEAAAKSGKSNVLHE